MFLQSWSIHINRSIGKILMPNLWLNRLPFEANSKRRARVKYCVICAKLVLTNSLSVVHINSQGCFFKVGYSRPLYLYFGLFQQPLQFLQQIYLCEKSPSSMQCCDLNPRPSEHESPPITIRRLPPVILRTV